MKNQNQISAICNADLRRSRSTQHINTAYKVVKLWIAVFLMVTVKNLQAQSPVELELTSPQLSLVKR
jgi:hypothetical protein